MLKPHQMEEANCIMTVSGWVAPRWAGVWELMMSTLVTPPCYLIINQSENHTWADHAPWDSLTHLAFKSSSLKACIREFESFERSPLYSLLGACTKHCTFFYHNPMSVNCLCCQVSRPKFDLVSARCRMMHLRPYVSLLALSFFAWRWWDILWACGKWWSLHQPESLKDYEELLLIHTVFIVISYPDFEVLLLHSNLGNPDWFTVSEMIP